MHNSTENIEKIIALLPIETQSLFYSLGKKLTITKGDFLLKSGEICQNLFIVEQGVFRTYRNIRKDESILEVTSGFSFPGDFETSPSSLILKIPSYENIQAITNGEVLAFNFFELEDIKSTCPEFNNLILNALVDYSTAIETILFDFRILSARERYEKLLTDHPEYVKLIPLKYLASFLNMTEETLSRIRKQ